MPVLKRRRIKGTVPGVIDHGEELLHILRVDGPGERVGELQPDPSSSGHDPGDDILLHEEVEKGDDGGHPGPHCRDVHAPVLLVLDEGFEVGPFDLVRSVLPDRP